MKINISGYSLLFILIFVLSPIQAQVNLVQNGKSHSRIILNPDSRINRTAANILQRFVEEESRCKLPIISSQSSRKNDIVLGGETTEKVTHDGFCFSTTDKKLNIAGKGNGTVYGVIKLLEQYLGIDYWGDHEYSLSKKPSIQLPLVDFVENPTFRYRQSQNYALATDTIYRWWYRLEEPDEVFAANYWVHTFNQLLPASVYGVSHPEYYAYYNGKRHPGNASQWCLTNPEVLEIAVHRIDSIFKANPGMNTICVSQNDGNNTNCKCENCSKIDKEEGAYSGSIIRFINQIAARFPDKQIATLAYLYSMKPPKQVKPLPNVVIMLCDIDCKREVSLTENSSGQDFTKALEDWAKITNNIFVWDYGINFDNYISPFPNLHVLQDNIRLFRKNHVTMHFSQIASNRGGDFAELRTYLVSKLMWNADANVDSLTQHFLNGYYGAAAPYLYQYTKIMEGALISSGKDLWIYDSPVTHKDGMLKPTLMSRYNALFDEAEKSVADNNIFLKRVQRTRLPLEYAALEIARTEPNMDYDKTRKELDLFEQHTKEFDIPTLNERNNPPAEYCELYRNRYLQKTDCSLAHGAKVTYLIPPAPKYTAIAQTALTDGLYGGTTYVESWIGWQGTDGAFIVDLGNIKQLHSVSTDFLHQLGAWILLPKQVTYSYSTDGKKYILWDTCNIPETRINKVLFKEVTANSTVSINARYIKVEVTGTKECPSWHYGVGYPSWFFIDEVTVK